MGFFCRFCKKCKKTSQSLEIRIFFEKNRKIFAENCCKIKMLVRQYLRIFLYTQDMDENINLKKWKFSAYEAKRENLVPALQDVQEKDGYISEEAVSALSEYFSITRSDIYSVCSFYAQFKFKKPGKHIIKVCKGTACHVRGSGSLLAALEERLGIKEGETTPDGLISLERVACLGACALAPAIVVDDKVYGRVTLAQLKKILEGLK